jgi:hypothetical protein
MGRYSNYKIILYDTGALAIEKEMRKGARKV